MRDWVKTSGQASVVLQFLFGVASLFGFINIDRKPEFLQTLLIVDVAVQFVEFLFYIVFLRLKTMKTYYRYFDWYLTTPTMLVTTAALMQYFNDPTITIDRFASTFTNEIIYIILMNSMMLSFGFVAEIGYADTRLCTVLGFVPFIATFTVIFVKFSLSQDAFIIALVVSVIWSMYGFCALLNYSLKNIGYNILDILSKNLFGLFLSVYLLAYVKETTTR